MKAEHINPLFEATQSVLTNMLQADPNKGDLSTQEHHFIAERINASIGVTGDLEGFVYFTMDEETALNVVEKMSGMPVEEVNDMAKSAVGELANIITGNAATNLSNVGYQCDITPPSIAVGDNLEISTDYGDFLVIPLHSELGDIKINVSLKEK